VISQRAKYALHAFLALARANESLMVGEIAASERIPRKFLEQILLELKRHGLCRTAAVGSAVMAFLCPPTTSPSGRCCVFSMGRLHRFRA
jgi:hypothetical protein